jgi:putative membrane protein
MGAILWIIVLGLGGVLVYYVLKNARERDAGGPGKDDAVEILKKRYARGEIDQETYKRMLADLAGEEHNK